MPAVFRPDPRPRLRSTLCLLVVALAAAPAVAEKADRGKPLVMEADRQGVVDLQRQVLVYEGNAVITQGTMQMRADRIEVRQGTDGFYAASAAGSAGRPATWRQRRDGPGDEFIEGSAERIEYDGRTDTLRFSGNGMVKRTRGGVLADEITGGTIVWDNLAEVFRVEGAAASPTNPQGRVRAVLVPRAEAPASAPGAVPGAGALEPSRSLGGRR